jgi:multisubunit Na+/H+ antiporter MnhG subunit
LNNLGKEPVNNVLQGKDPGHVSSLEAGEIACFVNLLLAEMFRFASILYVKRLFDLLIRLDGRSESRLLGDRICLFGYWIYLTSKFTYLLEQWMSNFY